MKMRKTMFKPSLLLLLLCLTFVTCKKNDVESVDPEMNFKLRLLNEKGVESTSFKEGEKFWLSFLITNRIKETRFFTSDNLENNSNLFRIVKADGSLDLGQPYEKVLCAIDKLTIKSKASLEFRIPWRSDSIRTTSFCSQSVKKQMPAKGSYKTSFEGYLQIGMLESTRLTPKIKLSVNFEIK
jgi:hypothetical protein